LSNTCNSARLPHFQLRQYDERMSMGETIFLFILALVIFGPKKLPEIARQVGKYLNEFKRASNEFKAQIEQEIAHLETDNKQTIHTPMNAPDGVMSRTLVSVPYDGAADSRSPDTEAQATLAATATEASSNGSAPKSGATEAIAAGPAPTEATPTEAASTEPMTSTSQESHA
jgi:sec-independent protein translocase protein TatB